MQVAGGLADVLGDGRRERDHVVMRRLLDLFDAGDVEARLRAQLARGVRGNDAGRRHRVGGGQLDLEPRLVASLLGPDAAHLGVGVSRNHRRQSADVSECTECTETAEDARCTQVQRALTRILRAYSVHSGTL